MKRKKSIKPLKILFKYNFTIKWPKNAIIIIAMIFHDFPLKKDQAKSQRAAGGSLEKKEGYGSQK